MSMTGLTPEQRRLVEQAGDRPVRIDDPEMHQAYVLIRADVYERVRDVIEPRSDDEVHVAEGIRKSQEAFFRDLPELLKDLRLRGKYVAYHGNERVKVAKSETQVIRECARRGVFQTTSMISSSSSLRDPNRSRSITHHLGTKHEDPRPPEVLPRCPSAPNPARLPILGLRALVRNHLKLILDGKRRVVTLRTSGWF